LLDRLAAPTDPLTDQLLEGALAGVLVVDEQGRLVRSNARVCQMIGHVGSMRRGLPAMRLFAAEERETLWRVLRGVWHQQPVPAALNARLLREGAAELAVELTPLALRDADGAVYGVLLAVTDQTVRRQLEAQLAHGQRLQALGHLTACIAHDFNNLLMVIGGTAQLISERDGIDAETRADAEEIGGGVARGAALVQQLLGLGGAQAPQVRPVVIDDSIRALSGLLVRLLERRIGLALDLRGDGAAAVIDPSQLDQVLINLAVNARDAMPGGGTLTLQSRRTELRAPMESGVERIPAGRYVRVEVRDTGVGIPPAVMAQVFEPFFTTRQDAGGTGLGLATVRSIARQAAGFVGIDSVPSGGTGIQLYLPLHETPRPEPPADALAASQPIGTVLVVEDEAAVLRLAERALVSAGWRVLTADSAEAALVLPAVLEAAPGLLISDLVLPGLDGAALADALRRRWPGLPVLLVSGYADARIRESLGSSGFAFMAKPYRLAELVSRVAAITNRTDGA
jgi:two-component system cell cycle sensor histidine kinase/response regulator CckA